MWTYFVAGTIDPARAQQVAASSVAPAPSQVTPTLTALHYGVWLPWYIMNGESGTRPRTVGQARMTYIEQAIKEAVDHGYQPNVERYPEMEGISPLQIAIAMQADVFIDPAFWKALGKKRGWTTDDDFKYWQKSVAEWEDKYWKKFWHRFIDHLAEDKDAESFFKALDSPPRQRPDSHH